MTTETKTLTYDHIVALALEHGFKLKPQSDGRMALNDYVIDFARAVYDIGRAAAKSETADVGEPVAFAHFAENGNIRLWAPERPRDLDGNAAHPLYTADQLAAAVAAATETTLRAGQEAPQPAAQQGDGWRDGLWQVAEALGCLPCSFDEMLLKARAAAEDAARLDWLTFNISGKALRDIGVIWSEHGDARRAIDAARTQQDAG